MIFCGKLNKSLQIVNSSLETINEIKLKNSPLKIILSDDRDHLIIAEWAGTIEIINIHDWQVVKSIKISTDYYIMDIAKIQNTNEYALAIANGNFTNGRLQVIEMIRNSQTFDLRETRKFLDNQPVLCVKQLNAKHLIVGIYNNNKFQIVNLKTRKVDK